MLRCCCLSFLYSLSGFGPCSNQSENQVLAVNNKVSGAKCYLVNLVDPAFKIIVKVK